ncbi:MAG: response regulator [Candidatus Omnitrophota bacterium]|nr:response regulator [Candidatus Omnitrophota bacterium]
MPNGKKKILLIDDEPAFTRLLKMNLEKTGAYEVREEHVGSLGLAAAKEFKPDLVLLDVVMPDIDGGTVVSQIRCSEELKNTRVVFLTAVITQKEISTQSGMLNSVPCIAKPVSTEDLIACIEKYTKKD